MSLTLRNSERRRRKRTDEKLPGGTSARAMAPTQMKLRLRRRGAAAGDAGDAGDAAAGARQPEHEEERTCQSAARSSRRKNSNRASAADASSSPPGSSVSAQAEVMMAEDASPDSKCPICLDRFNNLAYLDRCLHRFCFPCIQEWSHNKAECPLCKQPFASILHSVRAEDDFKEYTLQPAPNNSSVAATVAMVAAMASAARSNHHMRLMLRRHRGGDAGDRRRRRERRGRRRPGSRTGERVAMGEWYLDSSVALPRYASASPILTDSDEADDLDEQRMSDGADSSDGGVIFEGMMRLGGAVVPVSSSNRESRRMMIQLAARRRMQQESGTARHVRERETMAFRRDLYRCGIRVNGVATISNQGQQQQHDITAESFRRNPELLNRLRPWLRRELMVLYGAHGSLVDIIQRIIMARLARHGLEDTPTIEDELRPFLLARTDHFLHELVSFARSPLSLETYDLQAVYEPPTAPLELEAISSSSDSGSIIAISEGEEEQGLLGGDQDRAGCGGSDVIQTRNNLSQSAWDDETPGPSYSAAEPSCSLSSLSFSPTRPEVGQEDEGEREEEEEEECLIVGYKKPIAERTPELVQLSSDSEEEEPEQEKKEEDKLPVSPSTTAPLPTIPPSTSGMCRNEQEEESKQKAAEVCEQTFCSESSRKSLGDPGGRGHGAEGRRGQRGVKEQQRRRSGTLSNPNRCLYPAMMRRRSSSPFQSSAESSPPDSSWEYSCSQVSPLTSSASSPSRVSWSSSPPRSSPHLTVQGPPTSAATPRECPEKPGGKRKYKSRHLDSNSEDPSWKPKSRSSHRRERRKERKKKERRRRRREEGRKGDKSQRPSQGGGRSREDRSPSVEIIYEGSVGSNATHKRRRKEDHRRPRGRSPVIITIHSDGSQDGADGGSLLSSQQTLDVSHLLPLPMVLPDGVHQTANAEGGELPVDMLNQEFHGSDQEPPGQTQGSSDHDVDVETVEGNDFLSGSEEAKRSEVVDVDSSSQPAGQSHAEVSDSHLLASILGELQVVAQPKCSFSSSCEGHPSSVTPACDQGPELSQATPDLPPLLKQVSPVRSYSRNTPPPLKRSDAPSPRPRHPDAGTRWSAPGSSSQAASVSAGCFQDHSFLSSEWQPERREMFSAARRAPADLLWDSSASTVGFPPAACGDAPARSHRNVDLSAPCGAAGSSGVNHSHIVSDDLVPPLECGPDAHPSPAEVNAPAQASSLLIMAANLRCVSSDISSQNPSGSASGDLRDASSLGHEEPPPAAFQQTTGLKRSAAPLAHHTALSSAASSSASTDARPDLLADPQDSPPAVQFH
ncbi:E3 ubiquitin-protein ligase Topors-like isoform X2 [Takifugu rubripes]|uniref:E3 ubiquitin-protein ligase Topors-like isoform X2 n=1 Tax=Takifugu rubripes TaxID=31033 RepID=UPI00114538A5|nr:E3 ubiquitin-protein ligase Topors-like isoform X2 [Takifugu rubripes]